MIILDTNVVSEFRGRKHSEVVLAWLDLQRMEDLYLTVITVAEIHFGLAVVASDDRRSALRTDYDAIEAEFEGRILPLERDAAMLYGEICARRKKAGRPIETKDAMIAAICIHHGATLATRNVKDFEGLDLKLVNPFEGAS